MEASTFDIYNANIDSFENYIHTDVESVQSMERESGKCFKGKVQPILNDKMLRSNNQVEVLVVQLYVDRFLLSGCTSVQNHSTQNAKREMLLEDSAFDR